MRVNGAIAMLACSALGCMTSCSHQDEQSSSATTVAAVTQKPDSSVSSRAALMHDFGRVSLSEGPVIREHTFTIENPTQTTLRIADITKSLGCLDAHLYPEEISPGETGHFTMVAELTSPGQILHGATLTFDNGSQIECAVRAYGTLDVELIAVRQTQHIDAETGRYTFTLYLVDSDGVVESEPPFVVDRDDVVLSFPGWTFLEKPITGVRPARQLATVTLDMRAVAHALPITITLGTSRGGRCTIDIWPPDDGSCR